jgi:hypothetical protein
MRVLEIRDVSDLLRAVDKLRVEGVHCFRGQASAAWGLIPLLYRGLDGIGLPLTYDDARTLGQIERDVYRQFSIRSRRFLPADLRSTMVFRRDCLIGRVIRW